MMKYEATVVKYDPVTGAQVKVKTPYVRQNLKLQEVAELTQTDPDDIKWAIEEFGFFSVMVDGDEDCDWKVEEME